MNVYDAAMLRIKKAFDEFDNIYVSFSGGKDSGVLLNLVVKYIREYAPHRRIGVYHMDYEAQYQMTTDYVDAELKKNKDIVDYYHICLPIAAQCCTSMFQNHWIPWEKEKKDIWVRDLPKECVHEDSHPFDFFYKGMSDYDFQEKFANWYHNKNNATKTCTLVGIRTQESFHRWRCIHGTRNEGTNYRDSTNKDWIWSTKTFPNVFNLYPIYDWKTEDIWTVNAKNEWSYNKLYDIFNQAGLSLNQMRVASPFNDAAAENLKLYKVIDPVNWGKMIGRVNGVNFTGLYGGTTAMGWRSIKLPEGHTWKSYMEFLLTTLPKESADNYKKKLQTSIDYWQNKGGEHSDDTIAELRQMGITVTAAELNPITNRRKIQLEYQDDIDAKEFKGLPSYKRMCICILKNDWACKYMGFGQTKNELQIRRAAELKYKNIALPTKKSITV